PAPGSNEWFAPAPPPPAAGSGAIEPMTVIRTITPGVLITLAVGVFFFPIAPITLCIAFALSTRITVAKQTVRNVFLAGLGVLAFFALIGALTDSDTFGDWWNFIAGWSVAISIGVALGLLGVVYRALKNPGPSRGYQRPWS